MKHILGTVLLLLLASASAEAQRAPRPAGPANPFWGNTDAIAQGETLYTQNCTACHGAMGAVGPTGPAILHQNMSQALRGEQSDGEIVLTTRNGVAGSLMPAFQGKLADDDILKIGAYLHALRGNAFDAPPPGDVMHGQQVFVGKGQCSSCHSINGQGGIIGPDLTTIGSERTRAELINAMTKPHHRIMPDGGAHLRELPVMDTYDAVHVVLKNGKSLDGVLVDQDSYSMQMIGNDNQFHHIDRVDVKTLTNKPALMPTDYDKRLTPAEFTDVIAYLSRQGRKASPAAGRGGAAPAE